jgi:acetyl/propionyl-CoA carboxylase alpha subunit
MPDSIEGLRIDAGVEQGMEIGIHYDPMLAKLIAHGETRDAAIRKLVYALRQSSIQGLQTNRDFLIRLLEHQEFKQGGAHTGFIAEHLDELSSDDNSPLSQASLAAAALYLQKQWQTSNGLLSELPPGYRNNPYRDPSVKLQIGEEQVEVSWRHVADDRCEVSVFGSSVAAQVLCCAPGRLRIALDGVQRTFRIIEANDELYVHSSLGSRVVKRLPRHPIHHVAADEGSANSPMPGQVLKVPVEAGQKVAAGDPLIILEAMKMEHTMRAAVEGVVEAVLVSQGEVVAPGQVLVRIAAGE